MGRDDDIKYRTPDNAAVAGEDEVNFDRVTKVYREESARKTLVNLEEDFWDKLASYIRRLEEDAKRETQAGPNAPKAMMLQDELRKVLKRRDQIFTYRERKLALLASSRAGGADTEMIVLPRQERALFEQMVGLLKQMRTEAFGGSPFGTETGAAATTQADEGSEKPERQAAPSMRTLRSEETKRPRAVPSLKDHVLVHVLEDIPPFAGLDTTYLLKKEDVITLPKTIAQILVDRGKARIIQVRETPA